MHVKHRNEKMPSIELLRKRVSYDPVTGVLSWRPCGIELFKDQHGWAVWHGKFAGKPVAKRSRGYIVVTISIDGKSVHMQGHRVAWALMTGAWPEHEVDHRDTDPGNNKWNNLRAATHQKNQWNKGVGKTNRSGFKGVHQSKQTGKWIAQIAIEGRTRHLGVFTDPSIASQAYQRASVAVHGQFFKNI